MGAKKTPVGLMPKQEDFEGEVDQRLFGIDYEAWQKEVKELENYFSIFQDRLPRGIKKQLELLKKRLDDAHCCAASEKGECCCRS